MKKEIKKQKEENVYPKTLETFKDIGNYEINSVMQREPSCFNGSVRIRKYKITIELIEEPNEVYAERLEHLWSTADNHHHYAPLETAAKRIGYKFKERFGLYKK